MRGQVVVGVLHVPQVVRQDETPGHVGPQHVVVLFGGVDAPPARHAQDVQNAVSGKIQEFYSLAEKFINLIGTANLSNELKVGTFLSYKEDDKKYDPVLFMRTFMFLCNEYKDTITERLLHRYKSYLLVMVWRRR